MKRQVIIGFAISLACLVYVLRDVDFAELWRLTLDVNPLYYLWVNVSLALSMWVRSYRWRLLLSPVKACRIEPLYSANLIGFMANDLLPARLGEFVRSYAAGRLEGIPASTTLATIVVERVLDGLCMLLVLFLALLFADPSAQAGAFNVAYLRGVGFALLALYLGVLAVSVGLWRMPQVTTKLITGIAGRISSSLAQKKGRRVAGDLQPGAGGAGPVPSPAADNPAKPGCVAFSAGYVCGLFTCGGPAGEPFDGGHGPGWRGSGSGGAGRAGLHRNLSAGHHVGPDAGGSR